MRISGSAQTSPVSSDLILQGVSAPIASFTDHPCWASVDQMWESRAEFESYLKQLLARGLWGPGQVF